MEDSKTKQDLLSQEIEAMNQFTKDKNFDQILSLSDWKGEDVKVPKTTEKDEEMKDDGEGKKESGAKADGDGSFEGGGIHTNDDSTVRQYFSYYAKLANQQNML